MSCSSSDLKRQIGKIVFSLRENEYEYGSLDLPASVNVDEIISDGWISNRRRIVLNTHGCSVATCTMCPLPDESVPGHITVTDQNLMNQIDSALNGSIEDVITVYNNGNFFSDREISPFVREYLYKKVSATKATCLVVECLPQFITEDKLVHAEEFLHGVTLTVAIGLQSWNDDVREIAINSTCTKKSFLKAIDLLHKYRYDSQVFLMFKSPFMTTLESIDDVVNGVNELNKLRVKNIIVSPLRITKNTMVWDLYNKGLYFPPTQWGLNELLVRLDSQTYDDNVRIAMSILTGADGIDSIRVPITDEFLEDVKIYNTHPPFYFPQNKSKQLPIDLLKDNRTIRERVLDAVKI